ncbi:hypothetical protein K443DRAFT_548523 [Laccaria amethystina LaAM-08-1]|uniref:Uncharacterized protein n=1 Tax=Laccaria amethystina LaAM-08-1 TaxID=1095629 RepID=A0A0C9XJZ5_9AGAR|nr:hypothetical protein K443DRAFT_548523 [Laccaria amethystina LaAM-08-1]
MTTSTDSPHEQCPLQCQVIYSLEIFKFVEVCKYDASILCFLNLSYTVVQYTTFSPVLAPHILRYPFPE